jgi:hypothetical protein
MEFSYLQIDFEFSCLHLRIEDIIARIDLKIPFPTSTSSCS